MEDILKRLRTFFWLISVPAVAFFGLALITAEQSLVDNQIRYMMLVCLYLFALIIVPLTSYYMRRAYSKNESKPEEERWCNLAKAYKIRLIALNVISYVSTPIYIVTVERGCVYMVGIVTIVLLLSFPTRRYVFRIEED